MRTAVFRRALACRSITPDVSIPLLLIWMAVHSFISVSQYTSDVIAVSCYLNSTISTYFLSQKTVAVTYLAGRQRLFKLFRHVWWMCVLPLFDWTLVLTFTNDTRVSLLIRMWLRNVHRHVCGIVLRKSAKGEAFLYVSCAPVNILGIRLA
jgi:hypothetical protein